MPITRDDDPLGGEPRIEGTRVGVRHIAARVIESGQSPAYVANQLAIALAEVYEALADSNAHINKIRDLKRANEDAFERVRERSLKPNSAVTRGRILLDEHVSRVFERLLRGRGYDVEQAKNRFRGTRESPI